MNDSKKPADFGAAQIKRDPKGRRIVLEKASLIEQSLIRWLWKERIALGKMTLLAGSPGEGKTQIGIDVIARVTRGLAWPDGGIATLGSAIILSAEDAADDTICPRLEFAGADLNKVLILKHILTGDKAGSFDLQQDLDELKRQIHLLQDVKVIMIDPITAYLGDTDSHRTSDVRGILAPMETLAQETGAAILAITHPPKAAQTRAMNAFVGSQAFGAAPRLTFLAIAEPETGRSLLLAVKNNISVKAKGLGYRKEGGITGGGIPSCRIVWDNKPVYLTADEAMQETAPVDSAFLNAEKFLADFLKDGPRLANEGHAAAAELGISEITLKRAKKKLKVKSEKSDFDTGKWLWALPNKTANHED